MGDLYKPVCQVGAARSGTNLLYSIIRRHEDLAPLYTPKYIWRHGNAWHPDDCLTAEHARPRVVKFIRKRFSDHVRAMGKKRFFENTHGNVLALPFVNAVLPDCKIIHIIRDGRDNAASQLYRYSTPAMPVTRAVRQRLPDVPISDWPAYLPGFLSYVWSRATRQKYFSAIGPKIRNWKQLRHELDMLEYVAVNWRECVTSAREFGKTLPADRYYELRFERLLAEPHAVIDDLCEFLELPPSETMHEFATGKVDPTRAGRRRASLSDEDLARIRPHIKDLLVDLGYEEETRPLPDAMPR